LAFIILVIGLNLIVVEEDVFEFYSNSKVFIERIQNGGKVGVGDIKAFKITIKALSKLSKYYLGLSIMFIIGALTLPFLWPTIIWPLFQYFNLLYQCGSSAGAMGWIIMLLLLTITFIAIQLVASSVKNKLVS